MEPAAAPQQRAGARRSVREGLFVLVSVAVLLMIYRVCTELHLTHVASRFQIPSSIAPEVARTEATPSVARTEATPSVAIRRVTPEPSC